MSSRWLAQPCSDTVSRVHTIVNPDERELKGGFETFIRKYGFNRENRLLFFFGGHGYTQSGGQTG